MRRLITLLLLLSAASPALPQARLAGGATVNIGSATPVTISVNPPSSTVTVNATQNFTFTITADFANQGATLVLTGPGCSGATCGVLSAALVHTGNAVTYTAPATAPSPASATITATSVQDPTKFVSAQITITATAAPITINQPLDVPNKQPSAASLTFSITTVQGNGGIAVITSPNGSSFSSVTINPGAISLVSIGCTADFAGGGHTEIWYTPTPISSPTANSLVINNAAVQTGNTDVAFYDISNMGSTPLVGTGVCGGNTAASANPVGPVLVADNSGELVVAGITVNGSAQNVAAPFTFQALPRGDGTASFITAGSGTFTPSWTTTSGAYSFAGAVFRSGTTVGNVVVNVNPTVASVQNNTTRQFTALVANDPANGGVTWVPTGAGCAGATCGTVSPGSSASGVAVTYTAPSAVPSPATVTLTATSVTDGARSAAATITVTATPSIVVVVAPTNLSVQAGTAGSSFTATVSNDGSNGGVTWALTQGAPSCAASLCGTISPTSTGSGVAATYTPPASVSSTQSITLTATSVTDNSKSASATILVSPATQPQACASCPAFFGAQGGGATTPGGRGGKVWEITTTADSPGPCTATAVGFTGCSLRQFWNGSGARYGIFRVAGIFPVTAGDLRTSSPFLTLEGHSAPGEVILGGPSTSGALGGISTHDVVVRYVTYSPDNYSQGSGPDNGTTSIWIVNCAGGAQFGSGGCFNIIHEHVSTRWSGNKSWITTSNFTPGANGNGLGTGPNKSITLQWSLMYEPHEGHPVGYGTATDETCVGTRANGASGHPNCLSPFETDIDFHHDVIANTDHRIPENSNGSTRWINNIIFNWSFYANEYLGAEIIDAINNKYIQGNLNAGTPGPGGCGSFGCSGPAQTAPIHFTTNSPEMSGAPSVYVAGNIVGGTGANTPASNQYATSMTQQITGENGSEQGAIPSGWIRTSPMAAANNFPITVDSAQNLDSVLLPIVGNSRHLDCTGNWVSHRDAQDARIIAQYQSGGSGGFWPNGVSYTGQIAGVNGFVLPTPTTQWQDAAITSGFTVCTETLRDGIPDAWKSKYGLSLTDTTLYKTIDPTWGVPYIEVYYDGHAP